MEGKWGLEDLPEGGDALRQLLAEYDVQADEVVWLGWQVEHQMEVLEWAGATRARVLGYGYGYENGYENGYPSGYDPVAVLAVLDVLPGATHVTVRVARPGSPAAAWSQLTFWWDGNLPQLLDTFPVQGDRTIILPSLNTEEGI